MTGEAQILEHVCWPRCAMCLRSVPILVDDGDLCIRCDLVIYPSEAA